MPFNIIRDDITRVKADAIVNAANTRLLMGGGVCGAIFRAAGAEELQKECDAAGGCETGKAVITKGYNLPAKYIIHAVGPVWHGGGNAEEELLRSAYANALLLAEKHGLKSIAFPLISSGVYGFPKDKALRAAVDEIGAFLLEHEMNVTLVVFDRQSFEISEKTFRSVSEYIDDRYRGIREQASRVTQLPVEYDNMPVAGMAMLHPTAITESAAAPRSLDDIMDEMEETFSQTLLRLIDQKGKTDAEVYKKANIDRKLFSKIRGDKHYRPSKGTVLAFAVALELNLDETKDLLARAGFAISHCSKFDIIIEYFIANSQYNIFDINETLFAFEQPLLGA